MSLAPKQEECCPVMELALGRARETDRTGLRREQAINMKTGRFEPLLVIRIHQARKRSEPHANVGFCVVSHCPFCGANLEQKTASRSSSAPRRDRGAS